MKRTYTFDELALKPQIRAIKDYAKMLESLHSLQDWDVCFVIIELRKLGENFNKKGKIEE